MGTRLVAAALIAWAWPSAAQVPQGSVQAGVRGGVALVEVVTRVGFETTIVLPPDWRVVERRLGDPDRWIAAGGGHLTMVRPLARGAATNLSLVLSDGSVLSIGLRESDLSAVHTVVHLSGVLGEDAPPGEAGGAAAVEDRAALIEDVAAGTGAESPVLLSAADVEAIRLEEERALEALRRAEGEVRDRVEDAVAATDEAVEAFVAGYPTRLHFVFEFDPEVDVTAAPFWVEGMWHDTQSTFVRFRRAVDEIVVAGLLPDGTARVLSHEVIGVGLVIRVDGVVEAGILGVGDLGAGAVWRMRREAEPWQTGN
ncbi:MAG: TrbG/VirB9 family P-type conjugative transfer protein [Acidobacteria bacterium]|nr:TrbG/VirB9 family P-type conjugative transfer protein [Acidobacteriota bacterium]